jgi:tripartite-type tricarboxylate transporter receptor subunit TctC
MKSVIRYMAWLLIAGFSAAALAQSDYPSRPVRIIVPFPAGGSTDIFARDLGQILSKQWNTTIIVDNRPGASGQIGSQLVARSAPDGYNLLLTATHHVINPSLYRSLPYDTRRDFTPLNLVATVPNALVVNPRFSAQTVAELIRIGKEKPGSLSFASTGIGGANHLAGELFKSMTGVEMVHIPYKGAAPAMADLLGGQIPIMFDSLPTVIPHVQSGRLRALGVTSLKRAPSLPDVPTIDEAGVKGFEAIAWFGLYGPAKLPPELLNRISASVNRALATAEMRERLAKQGAEPGAMTQAHFASYVSAEIDKWGRVVQKANVKLD